MPEINGPLPDYDPYAPEVETKTITVTSTWRQTDTFEVPVDAEHGDLNELGALLDYIKLDPEGGGDISPDTAELIDWEVSG